MQIDSKKMSRFINDIYTLKLDDSMVLLYNNNTLYALSLSKNKDRYSMFDFGKVEFKNKQGIVIHESYIAMTTKVEEHPFLDITKDFFIVVDAQFKKHVKKLYNNYSSISFFKDIVAYNEYKGISINFNDNIKIDMSVDNMESFNMHYADIEKAVEIGSKVQKVSKDIRRVASVINLQNHEDMVDMCYTDGRLLYMKSLEGYLNNAYQGKVQFNVDLLKNVFRLKVFKNVDAMDIYYHSEKDVVFLNIEGYSFMFRTYIDDYFNIYGVIPNSIDNEVVSQYVYNKRDSNGIQRFIDTLPEGSKEKYDKIFMGRGHIVDLRSGNKIKAPITGEYFVNVRYLNIVSNDIFNNDYIVYTMAVLMSVNGNTKETILVGGLRPEEQDKIEAYRLTSDYIEVEEKSELLQEQVDAVKKEKGIFIPIENQDKVVDYFKNIWNSNGIEVDTKDIVSISMVDNVYYMNISVNDYIIAIRLGKVISHNSLPVDSNTKYFKDNKIDVICDGSLSLLEHLESYAI